LNSVSAEFKAARCLYRGLVTIRRQCGVEQENYTGLEAVA